jgi:molybdopterin synthase catalytic subunit
MIRVTENSIEPNQIYDTLETSGGGSVLCHYAVVRGRTGDQQTTSICFERAGDLEAELRDLEAGLKAQWALDDVLLIRRLGVVGPGDIISLVAVCAPRSPDAFESCRRGIEQLKKMKAIRKKEHFA